MALNLYGNRVHFAPRRTEQYPYVAVGRPHNLPYFFDHLRDFLLKTRSLPQIKCPHLDDDYFSFNIEPYRANTM
jgi:hypothetical protein